MDIGCGSGHLLTRAKELGLSSEGLELNPHLVNELKAQGFTVSDKKIEEVKQKYDLITMNHVIEHIDNLQEFLQSTGKALNNKGYLMLAFPYIYGIIPRILRTCWYGQGYGQHLNFFSIKSINLLLAKNQFEIIKIEKLSLDYSPSWIPLPFRIITNLISKITVASGLGDNIFIVARKL